MIFSIIASSHHFSWTILHCLYLGSALPHEMVIKSKDYQVEAAYNIDKASKFYIMHCGEENNHLYSIYYALATCVSLERQGASL